MAFDRFNLPRMPREQRRSRLYADVQRMLEDEVATSVLTFQQSGTDHTLLITEDGFEGNPSAANITLNLYAVATWSTKADMTRPVYVINSGSSGFDVVIDPSGGELINNAATYNVTDGKAVSILVENGRWWVVGAS